MPDRNAQRASFDDHTRILLSEQDHDHTDDAVSAIRAEVATTNTILRGVLISTTLAALALAANLAFNG